MLRLGHGYKVKLGCGCAFWATPDDVQRDQLWIGKTMMCARHRTGR
jgi:hypothetical protein